MSECLVEVDKYVAASLCGFSGYVATQCTWPDPAQMADAECEAMRSLAKSYSAVPNNTKDNGALMELLSLAAALNLKGKPKQVEKEIETQP